MTRLEALEVFGLPEDASNEDIKRTFHRLAHICSPDKGGTNYLLRKVVESKECLLDGKETPPDPSPTQSPGKTPEPKRRTQNGKTWWDPLFCDDTLEFPTDVFMKVVDSGQAVSFSSDKFEGVLEPLSLRITYVQSKIPVEFTVLTWKSIFHKLLGLSAISTSGVGYVSNTYPNSLRFSNEFDVLVSPGYHVLTAKILGKEVKHSCFTWKWEQVQKKVHSIKYKAAMSLEIGIVTKIRQKKN